MAVIKAQLRATDTQSLAEATRLADLELEDCHGTLDMAEGIAHFLERRPPRFPRLSQYDENR